MKRIALFLLIAVVAISSADAQKVKRKIQKEKDGYSWYLLKQGDIRGAENNRGTIIIPLEKKISKIDYGGGYFRAKSDFTEIYDTAGNVIVSKDRCYEYISNSIAFINNNGDIKTFHYFGMNYYGKKGMLDHNGVEVIPPQYDNYLDVAHNGAIYFGKWNGDIKEIYYIGYKFDEQGNIVPDPDHPIDNIDGPDSIEYYYEFTTYNSTYTPPIQNKQQSTSNKGNNNSKTQPKSPASSSSSTSSSSKPSTTRTPKERTHPFENYNTPVKCGQCRGTGMTNCWSCGGKGTIRKSGIDKNGKQVFRNERCNGCNGSGKRKCTVCNGKGVR